MEANCLGVGEAEAVSSFLNGDGFDNGSGCVVVCIIRLLDGCLTALNKSGAELIGNDGGLDGDGVITCHGLDLHHALHAHSHAAVRRHVDAIFLACLPLKWSKTSREEETDFVYFPEFRRSVKMESGYASVGAQNGLLIVDVDISVRAVALVHLRCMKANPSSCSFE
jgi:hypothetical protein